MMRGQSSVHNWRLLTPYFMGVLIKITKYSADRAAHSPSQPPMVKPGYSAHHKLLKIPKINACQDFNLAKFGVCLTQVHNKSYVLYKHSNKRLQQRYR